MENKPNLKIEKLVNIIWYVQTGGQNVLTFQSFLEAITYYNQKLTTDLIPSIWSHQCEFDFRPNQDLI